jgi:hypothetical protein
MLRGESVRRSLFLVCLLLPSVAYANVVWPALYLESRLFSWWAIGIGLLIEFFFVRWLFGLSARRAALADVSANAVSSIAGIVLVPLAGIAWELFPASLINWVFGWGTFNPVTWVGTFVLGCSVNALLEGAVYKRWFAPSFRFKSKAFLWLLAANSLSVGAAFISLWLKPVQPRSVTKKARSSLAVTRRSQAHAACLRIR